MKNVINKEKTIYKNKKNNICGCCEDLITKESFVWNKKIKAHVLLGKNGELQNDKRLNECHEDALDEDAINSKNFKMKEERNENNKDITPDFKKIGELMNRCFNFIEFSTCKIHGTILSKAFFCNFILCSTCQHRKSLAIERKVLEFTYHHLEEHRKDVPILLNSNIMSVKLNDIKEVIMQINSRWRTLMKIYIAEASPESWVRTLEIKYEKKKDAFCLVFHSLFIISENNFMKNKKFFIENNKFLNLCGTNQIMQLKIQFLKENDIKKLHFFAEEIAKYATDFSFIDNSKGKIKIDLRILGQLHYALDGYPVIKFGGLFKEYMKGIKIC